MIVTAFLYLIYGVFTVVINILPTGGLPAGVGTALTNFFSIAHGYDKLIPVTALITILGLILVLEGSIVLFRFGKYIVHLIRGN